MWCIVLQEMAELGKTLFYSFHYFTDTDHQHHTKE